MAQISSTKAGGVIRYDASDWMAGLIPNFANVNNLPGNKGFAWLSNINPFRKPGYLMPQANPTNAVTNSVIDARLTSAITGFSTYAYFGSSGAKLHKANLFNNDSLCEMTNDGNYPHTITPHSGHSDVVVQDLCLYSLSGVSKLFYAWGDGTDADIGMTDPELTTFYDDWMSNGENGSNKPTNFARLNKSSYWEHPLIHSEADDIMYIGDGNQVHAFDGGTAPGVLTKEKLVLPKIYTISSFAQTDNYLVIFAYRRPRLSTATVKGEVTAFFWDRVSADITRRVRLPGSYVNGGFEYKGTIGCFTYAADVDFKLTTGEAHSGKLMLYDGTNFVTAANFITPVGVIPNEGSVDVVDDKIFFQAGGVVYMYDGKLHKIATATGALTGICKALSDSALYVSSGTTTSGGLQIFYQNYAPSGVWRTPFLDVPFADLYKGRVKMVKVYWGEVASGGHPFTLKILTDKGATSNTIIDGLTTVTAGKMTTTYFSNSTGGALPEFDSLQLEGTYGSSTVTNVPPYVQAIEIYYDHLKI